MPNRNESRQVIEPTFSFIAYRLRLRILITVLVIRPSKFAALLIQFGNVEAEEFDNISVASLTDFAAHTEANSLWLYVFASKTAG